MSVTAIEKHAVLRRHERAMAVVRDVDDERARFALLDYVLYGNPVVEDAMRAVQTRFRSPLRRAAVIELAAHGLSLRQIADELGYANQSTPSRLLRSAS